MAAPSAARSLPSSDLDHVPAIGREAAIDLLGEGEVGRAVDRDPVGVVEHLEAAQPQVPGERRRFAGDALHEIAVRGQHPGAVVEERCAARREAGRELLAGDRHADRRGETLAERAGRRLDARSVAELRMAGSLRVELAEALELGYGQVVARHVQQGVEQRRGVAARQDEAVAVRPERIGGIVAEVPGPQQVGHRRLAERRAGVAGFRLLDHVDGEKTQGIDRELVDVAVARSGAGHEGWSLFDAPWGGSLRHSRRKCGSCFRRGRALWIRERRLRRGLAAASAYASYRRGVGRPRRRS